MKTTSSRFGLVSVDFDRKRNPSTGMSPKNGTFWVTSETSRWRMPPIARVSPCLTTTCVEAVGLLMLGTVPPVVLTSAPRELFSTLTTSLTLVMSPSSQMTVGVTSSLSRASLNWTWVPAELTVAYGISLPSEIAALEFSTVTTSGLASDVVLFSDSSASRTRLTLNFPPTIPKAMPAGVPPRAPGDTGKLTMLPPTGRPVSALTGRKLPRLRFELSKPAGGGTGEIPPLGGVISPRSEEHTSELQSHHDLVCRLLLEKK